MQASVAAIDTSPGLVEPSATTTDVRAEAPPIAEISAFDAAFVATAAALELLLLGAAISGRLSLQVALFFHVVVVAGLGVVLLRRRGEAADLTAPLLALIAVTASGPIGGVVMLALLVLLRRRAEPSALLAGWYARLSLSMTIEPETRLSERVATSRVIDIEAAAPGSFEEVMRSGAMEQRQRALGLVARAFHPSYLPTLKTALQSEEPLIRVQAAAVAAHIRARLAADVAGWIGEAEALAGGERAQHFDRGDARQLALIRDLDAAAASGLLDKPLEDAAGGAARRLVLGLDLAALRLPARPSVPLELLVDVLETRLLALGEFRRFRLLRRRRALARMGYPRLRRLRRRPVRVPVRKARAPVGGKREVWL
jgi:hypothetical protein